MASSLHLRYIRASNGVRSLILLSLLISLLSYLYWVSPGLRSALPPLPISYHTKPQAAPSSESSDLPGWVKVVWQTSKLPAEELSGEDKSHYDSWQNLNPDYEHVILTDTRMAQYVRENYGGTEAEEVFFEVQDYILLSDLVRYLILLKDGGVYNDLDVGCERAIETWVPPHFEPAAGVVLGVEVDNKFGPDGRTFEGGDDLFELVNWTMMARPNQPFMRFLVSRVISNLRERAKQQQTTIEGLKLHTIQEVLQITGPAAMTTAFFDYASNITRSRVTYKNFTKIQEPKMIGEVVILPIHAFGAGHQVEWAGFQKDQSKVLVHHYFAGSWYSDHVWDPPTKSAPVPSF